MYARVYLLSIAVEWRERKIRVSKRCDEQIKKQKEEKTMATNNALLKMIYDCWPTVTRNRSWIKTNNKMSNTTEFGWIYGSK